MKAKPRSQPGDLRPEYHFDYSTAVRGKYYRCILTEGANVTRDSGMCLPRSTGSSVEP